jgi:O-acetyl-ADP-ribose deacetylase (regulator of RNase III)
VRYVIHTVGPVWQGGGFGEAEVLASCYRRSLEVADGLGVRSIAFPAIATGVYGFPPEQAARIAVATVKSTPTRVERIRLVAFDESTRDYLAAGLDEAWQPPALKSLSRRSTAG